MCREWIQAQIAASDKAQISVLYASAYGNTAAIAQGISRGITKAGLSDFPSSSLLPKASKGLNIIRKTVKELYPPLSVCHCGSHVWNSRNIYGAIRLQSHSEAHLERLWLRMAHMMSFLGCAGVGINTLNLEVMPLDEVSKAVSESAGFVIGSPTLGGHMPTQVSCSSLFALS